MRPLPVDARQDGFRRRGTNPGTFRLTILPKVDNISLDFLGFCCLDKKCFGVELNVKSAYALVKVCCCSMRSRHSDNTTIHPPSQIIHVESTS